MAAAPSYISVLKAEFDYDPQPDADDELAIKEDQVLLLLERTDEDWWKVRIRTESQDDEGPSGLVPVAYVKPAPHTSVVKILYDYEATQPTELTIKEDEILYAYDQDEGWLLVGDKEGTRAGYIPGNYVEEVDEDAEASEVPSSGPSLSQIVVPPSPPRPAYVDPADRVASNKAQADDIQTWAVSEVDKKGKKKKGTLGVGNGAIFFASESDKTPVQKWQTSDIQSAKIDKSKHILVDIGGPSAISLHFHAGSKDTAEAILAKLESSRALSGAPGPSTSPPPEQPERPRSTAPKAVHFDASEPEIIPAPPTVEDEVESEPEPEYPHEQHEEEEIPQGGEPAIVLYDFTADGEDELSVREGETLLVLERDGDEWWKCRNQDGLVGVVPASYVELLPGANGVVPTVAVAAEDDSAAVAAREAEEREASKRDSADRERLEKERAEKERKAQAEQRAKAAALAAEADRRRREQEREKKERERAAIAAAEEEARRKKQAQKDRESSEGSKSPRKSDSSRSSLDKRGPPTGGVRTWHDRSGQFKVDAAFLGFANGKLRLHKINGVVIEVPAEKMSPEDMRYVEKMTTKPSVKSDDDDEPLENRRRSLVPAARAAAPPPKKGPTIDWFEFFLGAGCDIDDCTRYAQSFERDKIDEALLPDITESVMRSLGLREGDIIRVKKAIEQRQPRRDEKAEQLRKDEELARQLQAEENGSKRGQAPNLFAGPNGALKNNSVRRGRPQPSKSLPPATVDLDSIATASDQIQRTTTPQLGSPLSATPVQPPPRSSSAATASGFDDDAWTPRPSSTKPLTPIPATSAPRAPSAPPTSALAAAPAAPTPPPAPAAPGPILQSQSSPPPVRPQSTGSNLAKTTESDIFDQLARLSQYKAPVRNMTSPPSAVPSITTSPPIGYQSGLGMGPSPSPIGQHLQAQQTGMLPPPQPQQYTGARGPFAPVPANASLLQPLVPTTTGFNSFVPTRPQSTPSMFQPSQQPPPQPPSFLTSQPTGYPGQQQQGIFAQPTGFQTSGPLLSQPTGLPNNNFGGSFGNIPPVPPLPMNNGFNPVQSNPTGFNAGFGQSPFNQSISPAPPAQPPNDTSPANVFAKMKSGTFGTNDNSTPQSTSMICCARIQCPLVLSRQGGDMAWVVCKLDMATSNSEVRMYVYSELFPE
ncbi:unnamed protein product [Somion occarium]|uniref:Actin cytoskeleton-regulatory complex protein SLA1 n=1 Tax=Somion occarium TaxID=3059160 RepID=A0ABP1CZF1_9APHY